MLSSIIKTKKPKAFDLVEVNLEKPKHEVEKTLDIATKILNLLL